MPQRVFRYLMRVPARVLLRFRLWAYRMQFDRETYHGIPLQIHFRAPENARAAIVDALDLIARADPVSFANIPTLMPGGIAAEATNYAAAWYNRRSRTCFLGANTVANACTADIALSIIHELSHARLFAHGIGYQETIRVRVEKVCIRRERAFAQKLSALGLDVERLVDQLDHSLSNFAQAHVSDAELAHSGRRQVLERLRLLKDLDTPRWLRRWLVLRARRQMRTSRLAMLRAEAKH